ncbi:WD40 repeat-like protein [Artomyces pyxidatus]|uniref:WD40 repeat-like protein n=1 Tax=Artomyces pyxidatus TaxID=48021 RepID=A0ACB8SHY2_9AGAM|nr:WD40 repeat-like protein [Artomyces pyxidatus]
MESTSVSLPVVFATKTQYPLPTQKFMIPATWKRYQLSQLVNKALALARVVPFDFLVRGELLRASLGEWAAERGVGEEETLEIEYIESVMPPQRMASLPHEDWVSAISSTVPGHFLTASYDGNIRAFDYSQKLLLSTPAHGAPITSLCPVSGVGVPASDSYLIATASHDLTARLTELTFPTPPNSAMVSRPIASLHLHTAPLASIATSPQGKHLITASWDTLLGLWDTKLPDADEVPLESRSSKRRKVAGEGVRRKGPKAVLKSHTARVSAAVFDGEDSVVSCGFDSTVRMWDVESGVCTHTMTASEKPFLALALVSPSTALAASSDRTTTLYDLRAPTTITTPSASVTFTHPATPAALAFSRAPGSQQFVSGAYDGVVRLWDLRSAGHEIVKMQVKDGGKVLGVDWVGSVVGIAGEGGVEVWRVGEDSG